MTSNVLDIDTTATQVVAGIGGEHFNAVGVWGAVGQPDAGAMRWRRGTDTGDKLDGDVQTVHLDNGGIVYFGFHGGYNGNTGLRLMSASAATGALDPFLPATNGISGVEDITSTASLLAAVGDFTNSGGVRARRRRAVPLGLRRRHDDDPSTTTAPRHHSPHDLASSTTTPPSTPADHDQPRRPPTTTPTTPPPGGTVNVSPTVETPNRTPIGHERRRRRRHLGPPDRSVQEPDPRHRQAVWARRLPA